MCRWVKWTKCATQRMCICISRVEAYSINVDAEKTTDLAVLRPWWGRRKDAACQLAKGAPGQEGTAASVHTQCEEGRGMRTVLFRFTCTCSVFFLWCGLKLVCVSKRSAFFSNALWLMDVMKFALQDKFLMKLFGCLSLGLIPPNELTGCYLTRPICFAEEEGVSGVFWGGSPLISGLLTWWPYHVCDLLF